MEQITFQNAKIRDKITVLKHPDETNNEFMLLEVELKPGGRNGWHYHTSFTEEFFPMSGKLGVQVGRKKLSLAPGESAIVHTREHHFFFNPTNETIKFNVRISPANPGFLHSLQIAYGLANDGLTTKKGVPKKIDHLAVLLKLSDTRLTGLLGIISDLLIKRAGKLEKKGVKNMLIEKYC